MLQTQVNKVEIVDSGVNEKKNWGCIIIIVHQLAHFIYLYFHGLQTHVLSSDWFSDRAMWHANVVGHSSLYWAVCERHLEVKRNPQFEGTTTSIKETLELPLVSWRTGKWQSPQRLKTGMKSWVSLVILQAAILTVQLFWVVAIVTVALGNYQWKSLHYTVWSLRILQPSCTGASHNAPWMSAKRSCSTSVWKCLGSRAATRCIS